MMVLASCASSHDKPLTSAQTRQSPSIEPQALSADTNAQLKKVEHDFGVGLSIQGHQITLISPLVIGKVVDGTYTNATQFSNALERALQNVFGDDFTNYTWTPPRIY